MRFPDNDGFGSARPHPRARIYPDRGWAEGKACVRLFTACRWPPLLEENRLNIADDSAEAALADKVRPLVNDILARFNSEGITPQEAGMVILALTHRLLGVLKDHPEDRQAFVMKFINLVNTFLAGQMAPPA